MPMQRANFPKSLEAGLNAVWMSNSVTPEEWPRIFERKEVEQGRRGTGAPVPAWAPANQVGRGDDCRRHGRRSNAALPEYHRGADVPSREALEDNLYMDLGRRYMIDLQRAMKETEEIMAANVFNNAFSTSYPIGDGAALLSTSHPAVGRRHVQQQAGDATDFSESALEDLLIQIRNCVDDRTCRRRSNPKRLVVGNSNYFQAIRILRSMQRVGDRQRHQHDQSVGIFAMIRWYCGV